MTKMAAMPMVKTFKKILLRTLELGMQHRGLNLNKVYIISDYPGLTLTYLTTGSTLVAAMRLNGGKQMFPGGGLPLPRGYIQLYDHYFQINFPLKPFGLSKPNCIRSLAGKRGTKMVAMNIHLYGKNF